MSVLSLGGYLSTSGGTSPLPEIIFKFNQLVQPEMCLGLWSCVISTQPYVYHVTVLYWLFLHWHFFPHYPFWHTHIELSSESLSWAQSQENQSLGSLFQLYDLCWNMKTSWNFCSVLCGCCTLLVAVALWFSLKPINRIIGVAKWCSWSCFCLTAPGSPCSILHWCHI